LIFFPSRRIQWHFLVFVLLIYAAGRSVKSPSGGFVYPYTAEGVRVSRQIVELGTGGRVFHFLFSARTGLRSARGTSAPVINSWSGIPDFDFPDVYRRGSHAARAMSAAVFRNWYERSNSSVDITLTSTVRERYFSLYCRYFFEMIFFLTIIPPFRRAQFDGVSRRVLLHTLRFTHIFMKKRTLLDGRPTRVALVSSRHNNRVLQLTI